MTNQTSQKIDQDFLEVDELILHTENPEDNQYRHTTLPFLYEPAGEQIYLFIPLNIAQNDPPSWYQDLQEINQCLVEIAAVKIPATVTLDEAVDMEDHLDVIDNKYEPDEVRRFFPQKEAQLVRLDLQQSPLLNSDAHLEQ